MGFFSKVKAGTKATMAIDAALKEWKQYHLANPQVEPYLFMVKSWEANLEKAGKMMAALSGAETLKLYGCLPSPKCIEMMAHHMCLLLIPEYSETFQAQQTSKQMRPLLELYLANDATKLNELFRQHNPRTFEVALSETGERPFEQSSMEKAREMLSEL